MMTKVIVDNLYFTDRDIPSAAKCAYFSATESVVIQYPNGRTWLCGIDGDISIDVIEARIIDAVNVLTRPLP